MSKSTTGPTLEEVEALLEGELDWSRTKELVSGYKDPDRFEKVVDVFQDRVEFDEEILLPLSNKLFIVKNDGTFPVHCECGEELVDDYRKNWKLGALVNIAGEEKLQELYLEEGRPDPRYCEIREFICPSCGSQLEVETVPRGYPVLHDFLPDLQTFYDEWLDQPLEGSVEFEDLATDITNAWKEGGAHAE